MAVQMSQAAQIECGRMAAVRSTQEKGAVVVLGWNNEVLPSYSDSKFSYYWSVSVSKIQLLEYDQESG